MRKKTGHRRKKQGAEEKKQGFGLTEVWVAVVAEVASVGVAVVPVSHVGNGGVEGQLVRHEGAVVGVGGGHAGVVVGKGVGLGVSLRKCLLVMINMI